ncbi:DUF29 domain-containing protein [Thiospirillum jenense]|uniref:DUF29 domain-containing protein n=1 Tax=Thiospirillum jenense TaxID=1653858 RepID=A0A839HD55_9GAMM|nr:DUF29 domain-containing protein [Thiospirillum jenense]MBB1126444.1 DUF29 domain-containing protein [Thiospirillum jenense]
MSPDYDTDYYAWLISNAESLRAGRVTEIDTTRIAEELEDMGKSERRAIESWLKVLILHLLKWRYQPLHRSASWAQSIDNARDEIQQRLHDSPSLLPRLNEMIVARYPAARRAAMRETGLSLNTFPEDCPFTIAQLLDDAFWPEYANEMSQ